MAAIIVDEGNEASSRVRDDPRTEMPSKPVFIWLVRQIRMDYEMA